MSLEDDLQWRMPFTRYKPTFSRRYDEAFMEMDRDGEYVEIDEVMEVINLYRQEVIRLRTKLEMIHDEAE